ncbi:extracellular solute-binding protein [Deinococcus lacus]|uniref:Extracellular solute-binding protein n=1 Tax=Deinococcus lacus TaxID=392561 RepID=A0ABW1YHI1_9DEIO
MPASPQALTLYTTVNKAYAEDLVKAFEARTGQQVVIDAAAQGTADVVWLNNAAGFAGGKWVKLPATAKAAAYGPAAHDWLPLSVRFRSLIIHRDRAESSTLPKSLLDLPKVEALKGKIGWAVTSASFTDLVAALLTVHGEAKTREWLLGMQALEPRDFGNELSAMPDALQSGEIDAALSFAPWAARVRGAGYRIDNFFFAPGDVGNLSETSGVAIRSGSDKVDPALAFVHFLNQPDAQLFMATGTFDQPLNTGPLTPRGLVPPDALPRLAPTPDFIPQREKARALLIELDIL